MKVLVLGAGVIGTAAAWYLAKAGHRVVVIERRDQAGLETSFANGGQISASHAEPWANPSVLPKVLRWLGREDAPLLFRWHRWDPALWAWGLRFLANCTAARAAINTERTLRVALYSRDCLRALRDETGIRYDERRAGILHIYRDRAEFEHACAAAETMRAHGLAREVRNALECVALEPALAPARDELAGGLFSPGDESGDAHVFTRELARLAAASGGVEFRFGTSVRGLLAEGDRVTGIATSAGSMDADAVVLAAGSYSPLLARQLGLDLPIVPAKGYSITVPAGAGAPTVSLTDDENKLVYSRLGDRLRVAGTAEMTGYDTSLNPRRWKPLVDKARRLFPEGGDWTRVEAWTGLRPVTPDSVPILGPTRWRNLWLDTGHGTLGWTMACGSGKLIADLVSGRKPDIDTTGLGLERF